MTPHDLPRRSRESGIALIAAIGLLAVASAVMALLFIRTMDELRHGSDDTGIVQTLLVAQGGANLGVALLHNDAKHALNNIVSARSNTSGAWSFGNSGVKDDAPSIDSVATDLEVVAGLLQSRIDSLVCGEQDLGGGVNLSLRIYVTETACGTALPPGSSLGPGRFLSGARREEGGNQRYALPFVMVADGSQGDYRRRVVTQGEYRFVVGRRSFARYALFTDRHVSGDASGRIWFTSDTLFDGPVHTNGNFNFYGSPWFGGAVSSAGVTGERAQGAFGYGRSARWFRASSLEAGGNSPNMDWDGYENRPRFDDGVDWQADYIELPDNAFEQRTLAGEHGLLFERPVDWMELFAADANGHPIDDDEEATYQYIRVRLNTWGNNWRTETYRINSSRRLEMQRSDGGWDLVTDEFNGVIYSDRYIERLRGPGRASSGDPSTAGPALAAFSQLTVVPAQGARITGDLVYERQPCEGSLGRDRRGNISRAQCDDLDAKNVLGIFAPQGDILIGNQSGNLRAPDNVRIQGSLMTSNGVVQVEHYNSGNPRGAVELLGGIIEEEYGAFGTFNSSTGTMSTGYSRKFTFDPRLDRGLTPPYFPTVGIDGVSEVQTFTFGHREQVY